ncbi:MAG: hypothetical protein IPM63_06070 [Acidobacteriota bacterium]|nr:MAG: hypothetical protein IPM63_06070 [Acidobacteriota bacterium]
MEIADYLYLPAMLVAWTWISLYLLPAVRQFSEGKESRDVCRKTIHSAVERNRHRTKPGIICSFPLREVVRDEVRLY